MRRPDRVRLHPSIRRQRWLKEFAHRGDHEVRRQATAQGRPDALRWTCMLVCAFFCAYCTRDRGCSAHPAFPAPSVFSGVKDQAKLGRNAPRDRGRIFSCHRPRRRAIQYSRDVHDRTDKPRRTGSSAYAEDDGCGWGEGVRHEETPPSLSLTPSSPPSAPASLPPSPASEISGSCPSPSSEIHRRIRRNGESCCGRSGRGRRRGPRRR
jgi:hypothetical protein